MRDRKQEIIYHRAKLEKQTSYVRIYDCLTHTDEFFYPKKILGGGTYGQVRLFSSEQGNHVAVKSHIDKIQVFESKSERNMAAQAIEHEFVLLKQASRHQKQLELSASKNHKDIVQADGTKKRIYTFNYRLVEEFVPGMELRAFAETHVDNFEDMALLIFKAAEEANRIHHRGVIHGDISSRNMLVNKLSERDPVSYIDFGLAYFSDGLADVGYIKDKEKKSASVSMAPERFGNEKIPAHPSQDVFSLAMTFKKLLEMRPAEWIEEFRVSYPVIAKFIDKGCIKDDAKQRPSLTTFIRELKITLDHKRETRRNIRKA